MTEKVGSGRSVQWQETVGVATGHRCGSPRRAAAPARPKRRRAGKIPAPIELLIRPKRAAPTSRSISAPTRHGVHRPLWLRQSTFLRTLNRRNGHHPRDAPRASRDRRRTYTRAHRRRRPAPPVGMVFQSRTPSKSIFEMARMGAGKAWRGRGTSRKRWSRLHAAPWDEVKDGSAWRWRFGRAAKAAGIARALAIRPSGAEESGLGSTHARSGRELVYESSGSTPSSSSLPTCSRRPCRCHRLLWLESGGVRPTAASSQSSENHRGYARGRLGNARPDG